MPLDLANLSNAANGFQRQRRTPVDIARPEAANRSNEPEQRPRRGQESNHNQVEARERPTPPRRSAVADGGARQVQRSGENEFRRRLADGAGPQPSAPADEGVLAQKPVDGVADEVLDEGLTVGLFLPAALGDDVLSHVEVEVAASGEAIPEGAVVTDAGMVLDPELPLVEPEEIDPALLVAADPKLALPQAKPVDDGALHSQAIIEITVAGEVVPVTLQVIPPEITAPQPVAEESLAAIPTAMVASPTAVVSDGDAMHDPALLKAAPIALATPGQEGVRVQDPQAIQVAQQAIIGRTATAIQTAQAPAAVAEAALVALPVEGEPVQQTGLLNVASNNSQLSIGELRPVAPTTPPPPPQGGGEAAADKAVKHQVTRAIVQQMANGDRSLTLRLTPPHLGTVRIELVESRGAITVRFHAEDDKVRQAIERQLPQLRQDLRAADAPIASLRMEDGPHGWHQGQHQHGQHAGQFQERRGGGPAFSLDGGFAEEEDAASDESATRTLGGQVSDEAVDARA